VIRIGLVALASILVLAVLAGFVLLRTEAGLRYALSWGTSLAASEDLKVEIGEASGAIASDFTLTDIQISDRQGPWLSIDSARLAWRPMSLLSGVFSAETLDIGTVSVARTPVASTAPVDPNQPASSGLPVGIDIERFAVTNLVLAQPLVGTQASLTLTGAARLVDPAEGLKLDFDANRTDGVAGKIMARLGYVPDTGAIDARVTASEPQGGVVARLLAIPGLPPVELLVDGTGKIDAGLVTLALSAGDAGRVDATTRLSSAENGVKVDLDARGDLARMVPEAYSRLVEQQTSLSATAVVARDLSTVQFERADLTSAAANARITGRLDLSSDNNDLTFDVALGDVERFIGLVPAPVRWVSLGAKGRATGALARPDVTAKITGKDVVYDTRQIGNLAADVTAVSNGNVYDVKAQVGADALALQLPYGDELIGDRLNLSVTASQLADGSFRLSQLQVRGVDLQLAFEGTASPAAVDGDLAVSTPRVTLTAEIDATDLQTQPKGTVSIDGTADGAPITGNTAFAMEDTGVRLDDLSLETRSVQLNGSMLATPENPSGDITLTIGDLSDLSAFLPGAKGALDAKVTLGGSGTSTLAKVEASARDLVASGVAVGTATLNADVVDPFGTRVIKGRLTAERIAAGVDVPRVELTVDGPIDAAMIALKTEAMGSTVALDGTLSAADMALQLQHLDVTRQALRVTLAEPTRLRVVDGAVVTDGITLRANDGRITARGRAGSTLDLNVVIQQLPLSIAEAFAPGLGINGTLNGTATVSGAAAAPNGNYELSVAGLSVPQTRDFGLAAFAVKANGTLANGRTNLNVTATGSGTNLQLTGSAPLGAGDLDLRAQGRADAGLLNTRLAATGERLAGTVTIDATIRGSTTAPVIGGSARLAGGSFSSPGLGLNLTNMNAAVSGDGRSVSLSSFTASTPGGGTLRGQGRVAIDPAGGFPGNLTITADNAQVADTSIVKARADARITLEGPLAREPRIAGTITVKRMEITLPERFPAGATAIEVEHRNAPPEIRRRVAREAAKERQAEASQSAFNAELDLTIAAGNQVFLRGQGIDAELSGDLRIRGSTSAPQIDGGFEMRRGTLSILGQRLEFSRGIVTFPGEVTPVLDLVAETKSGDVTAFIAVTGSASSPGFALSSSPSLPQDEVMARLLFNRATGELSPGQAIQIAQALASLTGNGGPGALDAIRRNLGVDTLDVTTDESGSPAVAVGRYINDNISIGARQGATPESSRVTVDIDVTEHVRIQGAAGAGGESKVGIGVEWEY
jgi:translocation and assembly module TamB